MTKGQTSLRIQPRTCDFIEEEYDYNQSIREETFSWFQAETETRLIHKIVSELPYQFPTTKWQVIDLDEYDENKDTDEYHDYYKESFSAIMHEETRTVNVCIKVPKYVWLHDGLHEFMHELIHYPSMQQTMYYFDYNEQYEHRYGGWSFDYELSNKWEKI